MEHNETSHTGSTHGDERRNTGTGGDPYGRPRRRAIDEMTAGPREIKSGSQGAAAEMGGNDTIRHPTNQQGQLIVAVTGNQGEIARLSTGEEAKALAGPELKIRRAFQCQRERILGKPLAVEDATGVTIAAGA
jgi:hypothetical protein